MPTSAQLPNIESTRLLRQLVDQSKRHTGVPFGVSFLRTESHDHPPPLARLIQGGRGGEIRLKLYLCLTLRAVRQPYDIKPTPASAWAQVLALPDPAGLGARRISD